MHFLYCFLCGLAVLWVLIWIDAKRTKAEGWVKEGPGMAKRFPKKTPVIEEHELHFHEDQKN
jgi:hypothetical protein